MILIGLLKNRADRF